MKRSLKVLISITVLIIIAFLITIFAGSKIYTDVLWFKELGYLQTFLIMFFSNFGIRILVGVIFTLFLFINLSFTKKIFLNFANYNQEDNIESLFENKQNNFLNWLNNKRLTYIYLLMSILLGFLFSSISRDLWQIVLKFFNKTPFNTTDPIFGKDIGFYVFSLPFLSFIKEMGMVLVILTLIAVGIIYILASGINSIRDLGVKLTTRAKSHMTILVAAFLFLKAWDYRLSMYDLLFSEKGVVFGAGYADINANLLGLRILFFIAIAIGILVLSSLFRNNYRVIIYGLGIWLIASIALTSIYPAFVQRFQVEPNEIAREDEFIKHNIDMTLQAYGMDNVRTEDFEVKNDLDREALDEKDDIISSIRLWDPRPLESTYSQLQELRQYYDFINVDIDRYTVDGKYRQVMLAARELNQDKLSGQAKTWINRKLKYTHGFGVAMSPVNRLTSEGLPEFFIKDIPPKNETDIELDNSSIYYGEKTNDYVIANHGSREFHYPQGSQNVYTSYDGSGGVPVRNLFRKSLFALRYNNIKFLLNSDIIPESRVMYYRNIHERVRKVAPFLQFDSDPYLVVDQGQLWWIQDAYTTSNMYPYSRPAAKGDNNYIRNSIKIVIDAYNGDMKFYIMDDSDPLVKTYDKIFPDLFIDGEEMPDSMRNHIRYPKDLFKIQSELYSIYHMKDPAVFYNKEDLWNIPKENFAGNTQDVEPYYILSQLPGEEDPEFILMQPFTPATKNNMIAWMAARSDGEHYGELFVYNFPKDSHIYGPNQIESRIDQDSDISQLLSLWSQRGSRVIRGNLLVLPINNSLLYVEPLYIQAEESELPELKRVIVAFKDKIVMRQNLEMGLEAVFGAAEDDEDPKSVDETAGQMLELPGNLKELTEEAVNIYDQAQESQRQGNWSQYGSLLEELEQVLERLNELSQEELDNMDNIEDENND